MGGALLLGALLLPLDSAAQERAVRFGVGGGPSFPLGHVAEEGSTGFHLQASVETSLLPVPVRVDGIFQQFPHEDDGNFRGVGGLANVFLPLPLGAARPYVIAGLGLVRFSTPDEAHGDHAHAGEEGTEFAFNIGGGLGLNLFGLRSFLELRYFDAGEDHRGIPLTLGFMF